MYTISLTKNLTQTIIEQAPKGDAEYRSTGPLTTALNEEEWPCSVPNMTVTPWAYAEVKAIASLVGEDPEAVLELAFREWFEERRKLFDQLGWDAGFSAERILRKMTEKHQPSSPSPAP